MSNPKKKLFISCPMRGRSEDAIRHDIERMHKLAEIVFDQELEVIPTNIDNEPETGNMPIWCLGESIKKMSGADYFIGTSYMETFHGCEVEARVAQLYGIPSTYIDVEAMMPDVSEMERKAYMERINAEHCTGATHAPVPVCG